MDDANAEHDIYDNEGICDHPRPGERILGRNLEKHHATLSAMRGRAKIIGVNLEVWGSAKQNVIREVASWHCNFDCLNGFRSGSVGRTV
jgi:hypothetical protein